MRFQTLSPFVSLYILENILLYSQNYFQDFFLYFRFPVFEFLKN